jgi:DNA-binding GntR family transcriptional regulator
MSDNTIASINRPDSLAQQAYQALRNAIRDAILVQDKLYSESELARSMNISRTPVREALIELAREHLVEIVPQRGFRLKQISHSEQAEVFALRQVIEAFAVEKLAQQATPEQVKKLKQTLHKQAQVINNPGEFLQIDESFHLLIPQLVGLERTHTLLATLRGSLWLIGNAALQVRERAPVTLQEHEAIVAAIEANDSEAAVAAMRTHLDATAEAVRLSESVNPIPRP